MANVQPVKSTVRPHPEEIRADRKHGLHAVVAECFRIPRIVGIPAGCSSMPVNIPESVTGADPERPLRINCEAIDLLVLQSWGTGGVFGEPIKRLGLNIIPAKTTGCPQPQCSG